jgi:hypothetical protein
VAAETLRDWLKRYRLSRQVDDSFGVVQVGDYENVRVYHENQEIGLTNRSGAAFIPDMRSFDQNQIRIEQEDLPLDAQIEDLDSTAIPGFRQGALISFDVRSANGALMEILQENGKALPAGTTVNVIGRDERFPVARRGEAWVKGLRTKTGWRRAGTAGAVPSKWHYRIIPDRCRTSVPLSAGRQDHEKLEVSAIGRGRSALGITGACGGYLRCHGHWCRVRCLQSARRC